VKNSMDEKTTKNLEKKVLDCCEDSRTSDAFNGFTDEEYIGYQTAMVVSNSYNINASIEEKMQMVKKLFAEGKL